MNFMEEEIKEKNVPKLNEYTENATNNTTTVYENNNSGSLDQVFVFDFKTILIFFLLAFLILTFLGINLFTILGNSVQDLSNVFGPFFKNFLKSLGYSTGTVINESSDAVSDIAKTGIDIVDGSAKDIGNLLISSAASVETGKEKEKPKYTEPTPDDSTNSIQKPISSEKSNWCLVGEFQNKRGCVAITESDKCLSGQIFPNQAMCLNPTLTP